MRSNWFALQLYLAGAGLALAQPTAPQEPVEAAIRAVGQARTGAEAEAARDRARALLQEAPITSPGFARWAPEISRLYQTAGWNAKARSVLEDTLARTDALANGGNLRALILNFLAMAWQQDGNLLKTVATVEQLVAAEATAPRRPAESASVYYLRPGAKPDGWYYFNIIETYSRLANLYRLLGRPEAIAALTAKVRQRAASDPMQAAAYYRENELPEDAKAIFRDEAEHSNVQQATIHAWQALADVYASQQDFTGASDALRQAIAAAGAPENPGITAQRPTMQRRLIEYLRTAGHLDQADTVYQQLVQQSQGGPEEDGSVVDYARYLEQTQRVAQADTVLQEYLAAHPNLDSQAKSNIYNALAGIAQQKGDGGKADRYRQEAKALEPQPTGFWNGKIPLDGELREAETAAREHRLDDAYNLAMHALDSAGPSVAGQPDWMVPMVATSLANGGQPARAERLFQRLFTVLQDPPPTGSIQQLVVAHKNYLDFLMGHSAESAAVPAALDNYRHVLIEVNGANSATLADELWIRTQFELAQSAWQKAKASAGQLLEFQESMSGKTSEAYLYDLELAATIDEAAGDLPSALPLRRQAMAIADRLPRAAVRFQAGTALADVLDSLGQHEEATAVRGQFAAPRVVF